MELKKLLDEQPDEIEKQVKEAKNRYNTIIREAIRFETRLRLNRGDDNEKVFGRHDSTVSKVSVNVLAGVPEEIQDFNIPDEFEIAALLSEIKPDLAILRDSSNKVTAFINAYQDKKELFDYVGGAMAYAGEEADALLKYLEPYDLIKEILAINMDILGRYSFNDPSLKRDLWAEMNAVSLFDNSSSEIDPWATMSARISLYWQAIGLAANSMGVGVDALTAVVLAHELAHAYSHLGYDIDGTRWSDEGFIYSKKRVKEGVAQFYTEKVMLRLRYKIPGGYKAYKALLEKQPSDYHAHLAWAKHKRSISEAFRAALITLRKGEPITIDAFEWHLQREAEKLHGKRQAKRI